jgi:hypothetical protein
MPSKSDLIVAAIEIMANRGLVNFLDPELRVYFWGRR